MKEKSQLAKYRIVKETERFMPCNSAPYYKVEYKVEELISGDWEKICSFEDFNSALDAVNIYKDDNCCKKEIVWSD